jgi:hypothetical protein
LHTVKVLLQAGWQPEQPRVPPCRAAPRHRLGPLTSRTLCPFQHPASSIAVPIAGAALALEPFVACCRPPFRPRLSILSLIHCCWGHAATHHCTLGRLPRCCEPAPAARPRDLMPRPHCASPPPPAQLHPALCCLALSAFLLGQLAVSTTLTCNRVWRGGTCLRSAGCMPSQRRVHAKSAAGHAKSAASTVLGRA